MKFMAKRSSGRLPMSNCKWGVVIFGRNSNLGSEVGVKELASFRMNHTETWTANSIHVIGVTLFCPNSSEKNGPEKWNPRQKLQLWCSRYWDGWSALMPDNNWCWWLLNSWVQVTIIAYHFFRTASLQNLLQVQPLAKDVRFCSRGLNTAPATDCPMAHGWWWYTQPV